MVFKQEFQYGTLLKILVENQDCARQKAERVSEMDGAEKDDVFKEWPMCVLSVVHHNYICYLVSLLGVDECCLWHDLMTCTQ